MRGCKVTLFEKSGKIGGNFGTIASVGFKHRIRDLIWWYNNQLNKLGVDLRLNTEITADDPILGSARRDLPRHRLPCRWCRPFRVRICRTS